MLKFAAETCFHGEVHIPIDSVQYGTTPLITVDLLPTGVRTTILPDTLEAVHTLVLGMLCRDGSEIGAGLLWLIK